MPKLPRGKGPTMFAAGALALALATTALTPWVPDAVAQSAAPTAAQPAAPGPNTAVALPRPGIPDFSDIVARDAPAVVRVSITGHVEGTQAEIPPQLRGTPFERFFRQQMPRGERRIAGQGSGFIIDPAGYIVTNNHVVGEADSVKVELADGRELPAKVVGTDPQTDLALIKVDAGQKLPTVQWGDSDQLRVGQWVLAMGNPFGLGASATAGIVSARGRQIGAGAYDDFIQTDAAINPGNSGGPLFNTEGQVVGINSAIYSPSGANAGIGFAIPSRLAQSVIEQLRHGGKVERGWLGVSMQRLDDDLATAVGVPDRKGALIAGVERNSPAAKGGLQPGDVVVGFNGHDIAAPRDLAEAVGSLKPGAQATVTVLRNGQKAEEQVTLGTPPRQRTAALDDRDEQGHRSLGLALAPNGAEGGAVVAEVAPGSVAAERGLQQGDVILRAGGKPVEGPRDVVQALRDARQSKRNAIALQVERDGNRMFVALPLHGQG
jgi:serine protease Do